MPLSLTAPLGNVAATLLGVVSAPASNLGYGFNRVAALAGKAGLLFQQGGPWSPPQWSSNQPFSPPLTMLVVSGNTNTVYAFDAIIRGEHEQQVVITSNPVQTGAAINDHAYVVPPKLTVEIRMSDSMQSWKTGQWEDAPSRSISAYQALIGLMQPPTVISLIQTRLRTYSNMMISEVRASEDKTTKNALKAMVTFVQILTATVETISGNGVSPSSALPQVTNTTQIGSILTQPSTPNILSQNNINSLPPGTLSGVPAVSGAGNWSSYNVNMLPIVLPGVPTP